MQQSVTLSKLIRRLIENKDRPGLKICIYLDLSFLSSSSVKTMCKTAQFCFFFFWVFSVVFQRQAKIF